ncbi:MAG: DUF192 domain-containing protein [Parcubacteria group bacterium]|nr:DUF192 domain-containing protein [Parcubacteria group bacterium]
MYHSHARIWFPLAIVLGLGVVSFMIMLNGWYLEPTPHVSSRETTRVVVGGTQVETELAITPEERVQGLSGRPALPPNHGMLFLFETPGRYTFWMQGMQFAIDIIWIYRGRVVWIKENALPPIPGMPPEYFTPSHEANEVLEVTAGFVAHQHIKLGDTVTVIAPKEKSRGFDYYQQS